MFKVVDFGTNRKPIYDFLLVIIVTDLLSCTISKLRLIICEILARDSRRYTLTPSLGVIPFEYIAIIDISLKTIFFGLHFTPRMYRCIFNHFAKYGPKATEFGEITQTKRPLRHSRSFKVTDFGTNRKPIYDFLLVINSNLPPILRRFQVMADYWSKFRYR